MSTTAVATFDCDLHAPAMARAWGLEALQTVVVGSEELAGSIELVISELVTNAIRASCATVSVTVSVDSDRVRVRVRDDAPGRPTVLRAAPTDYQGRGLAIVTMLAEDWGVEAVAGGKEVWVELLLE